MKQNIQTTHIERSIDVQRYDIVVKRKHVQVILSDRESYGYLCPVNKTILLWVEVWCGDV